MSQISSLQGSVLVRRGGGPEPWGRDHPADRRVVVLTNQEQIDASLLERLLESTAG